ncbi:MAG TPA: tetratricopeptide repeat protein [Acidimicrobiales bacterium]|nr:tetratricopeptide repeat protein [Acidimicrobiales bacterium]
MLDDLFSPGWSRRMYGRMWASFATMYLASMFILSAVGLRQPDWPRDITDVLIGLMSSLIGGMITGSALSHARWPRRRRVRCLADSGLDEDGRVDPLAKPRYLLDQDRRRRGADHRAALKRAKTLAAEMTSVGRLEDAVSLLSDTFERAKRVLPHTDEPTWRAGDQLAWALAQQGRIHDAVQVGREVLDAQIRLHGPEHDLSIDAASRFGHYLRSAGQLHEAISVLGDTFEQSKQRAPDAERPTWWAGHELSLALAEAGQVDAAIQVGRDVLTSRQRLHGPDNDLALHTATTLGGWLLKVGRVGQAIELLANTWTQARNAACSDAVVASGTCLVAAYWQSNRHDEAQLVAGILLSEVGTESLGSKTAEFLQSLMTPGTQDRDIDPGDSR